MSCNSDRKGVLCEKQCVINTVWKWTISFLQKRFKVAGYCDLASEDTSPISCVFGILQTG
jgi:hypothetical protein